MLIYSVLTLTIISGIIEKSIVGRYTVDIFWKSIVWSIYGIFDIIKVEIRFFMSSGLFLLDRG